jgi:glycosyltransferase involved in cell wall biosynthesis
VIHKKFLFNFAASYSGGGFKRLYAYAKWFNENGGATFIIHPHCHYLQTEFPTNRFILANQSRLQRLFNDCGYLETIQKETGTPDVYYSYGIPVYQKFGRVNWFHLSNVLPLDAWHVPLSLFDRAKLDFLGKRIKRNFKNADIISAESNFSFSLIKPEHARKFRLSVNGSDDEIQFQQSGAFEKKENIAVVLGTYRYKALQDSYHVFEMLRANNPQLKLKIIGDETRIPDTLRRNESIIITGSLPRDKVIHELQKSLYYISTTHIENSYNAASEGIFFAEASFISDIGPHQELLAGMPFEKITVPNMKRPVLGVKRENISPAHLKTWNNVITEMIEHVAW